MKLEGSYEMNQVESISFLQQMGLIDFGFDEFYDSIFALRLFLEFYK